MFTFLFIYITAVFVSQNAAAIYIKYKISVYTANDSMFAGTDNTVIMTLRGDKGSTGQVRLINPDKNDFEKGNVDVYEDILTDVGKMSNLTVDASNNFFYDNWKLEKIIIEKDEKDSRVKALLKNATFEFNCWFDREHNNYTVSANKKDDCVNKYPETKRCCGKEETFVFGEQICCFEERKVMDIAEFISGECFFDTL